MLSPVAALRLNSAKQITNRIDATPGEIGRCAQGDRQDAGAASNAAAQTGR